VTIVTNVKTVRMCSKVAKIRFLKSFLALFDIKRDSEVYDSYFDNCPVIPKLNSVLKSRDNCH